MLQLTMAFPRGKLTHHLAGQRFGHWLALGLSPKRQANKVHWFCRCDCGSIGEVTTGNLRNGTSKSCGCFRNENKRPTGKRGGVTYAPEYKVYHDMLSRCYLPKC